MVHLTGLLASLMHLTVNTARVVLSGTTLHNRVEFDTGLVQRANLNCVLGSKTGKLPLGLRFVPTATRQSTTHRTNRHQSQTFHQSALNDVCNVFVPALSVNAGSDKRLVCCAACKLLCECDSRTLQRVVSAGHAIRESFAPVSRSGAGQLIRNLS